jgi:hypothetical protein
MKAVLILFLALCCLSAAGAAGKELNLLYSPLCVGLGFAQESFSETADIGGGSYLSLSLVFSFNNRFFIDLKYSTSLFPDSFEDRLASVTSYFGLFNDDEREMVLYVGPSYLNELGDMENYPYLGIALIPLSIGRHFLDDGVRASFHLLPLYFYQALDAPEFLFSFQMFHLTFFF